MTVRARAWIVGGLAAASAFALLLVGPVEQPRQYHTFADQTVFAGIPHFWNVVSNLPFLLVAVWGAWKLPAVFQQGWERTAFCVLLTGTALVAFGSGYYHWHPNDATLVWDRLPMTIVFMSLFATLIGERVSMRAGRLLLWPLIAVGMASVGYWVSAGDLRPYVMAQFYPMLAIPMMVGLFPGEYPGSGGVWSMGVLYVLAKLLELGDLRIAAVIPMGGHPLKHIAAAAALVCYIRAVKRRTVIPAPHGSIARTAG